MTFKVFFRKIGSFFKYIGNRSKFAFRWWLSKQAKHSVICWMFPNLRPIIWRWCGANVGKNVCIGWEVFLDIMYANYLVVEDDVWITNRAVMLCHRRDISHYYKYHRYKNEQTIPRFTVIKKGCAIGTGAMIMPGIIVGEGAVVGAYSLVTKDVPEWTVVAGVPAKVIKTLEKSTSDTNNENGCGDVQYIENEQYITMGGGVKGMV